MTGLSLSFCIHDIITGVVNIKDVDQIIAGTVWATEQEVLAGVERYCQEYWWKNPGKARKVFWQLWNAGRIVQPRVTGGYQDVNGIGRMDKRWIP